MHASASVLLNWRSVSASCIPRVYISIFRRGRSSDTPEVVQILADKERDRLELGHPSIPHDGRRHDGTVDGSEARPCSAVKVGRMFA